MNKKDDFKNIDLDCLGPIICVDPCPMPGNSLWKLIKKLLKKKS